MFCVSLKRRLRRLLASTAYDGSLELLLTVLEPQFVGPNDFVVEQGNAKEWNKGIVYNAGFDHVRRRYGAECFAFHDVDFIPKRAA